ncbi:uncharacterized protein FOMMEDRAFT_156132 [Fomitiporia mediterranea MF3/22]|uniref:uncharacterized protein n=1 Tax=Fomitiporia mediterranea (strain MF3/22) TaxID=694068 RepID=UPI0004407632|nr:uncharacterized protein FOMMEDRAFT_156132 [Fomitiporia mediterranea MF3/22]EJD02787.1 hypothetical protein FOMMEDRAFT_156132 [Fomitiporia mediterranea MF3/22]
MRTNRSTHVSQPAGITGPYQKIKTERARCKRVKEPGLLAEITLGKLGNNLAAFIEFLGGTIWARGLSHEHRSLACISILSSLGKQGQLSTHIYGALNNGPTGGNKRDPAASNRVLGYQLV